MPAMTTLKSLDMGLKVLCYVAAKKSAGPSEVSRELGCGKSTAVRILQTMEAPGFVRQLSDSRRYVLGHTVLELARGFLEERDSVVAAAVEEIRELWLRYGETVALFVREGDARVCLHRLESAERLRHTVRVGEVRPLHLGATGKAFMAYMRPDEVAGVLDRAGVEADRVRQLQREFVEIREKGVAFSIADRIPGSAAVAAPILNVRREAIAAIVIFAPIARATPTWFEEMTEPLAAAARRIASRVLA
jgi:IclR family KDG regulon transcriptional repressor